MTLFNNAADRTGPASASSRKWRVEDWREFGLKLIETEELDTSYTILQGAISSGALKDTSVENQFRYIQAYTQFKHNGVAFWSIDPDAKPLPAAIPWADDYWGRLRFAVCGSHSEHHAARTSYGVKAWRYTGMTRGMNTARAVTCIEDAKRREEEGCGLLYGLTELWGGMEQPLDYGIFHRHCQPFYMFGSGKVGKAACFTDAMGLREVDYRTFRGLNWSPAEGAALFFKYPITKDKDGHAKLKWEDESALIQLLTEEAKNPFWKDVKAPPLFNRELRFQEIETMACEFNHWHKHGTPIGREIFTKTRKVRDLAHVSPVCARTIEWCEQRWPELCG